MWFVSVTCLLKLWEQGSLERGCLQEPLLNTLPETSCVPHRELLQRWTDNFSLRIPQEAESKTSPHPVSEMKPKSMITTNL